MNREKEIYKVTILGGIGNCLLLIFKFAAGILGQSAAMIADAVHSLSDFITDVIVLVFVRISSKPSDTRHKYGHGKYETLATAIIAILLFAVGCILLYESCTKIWLFFHGVELEAPGMIAFIAAVVSIVVKEGLYRYTVAVARKVNSTVVEANAWHHRSDAFSSIGTTIGIGGAIFFGAHARVLDPLAAAVVSLFIMKVAWQLVKPALDELLERSLPADTEQQLLDAIMENPEVSEPHNMRTRRIGSYSAVEVHVRMPADMTVAQSHAVTKQIEGRIRMLLGPQTYINIHVEPKEN